MNDAVFAGSSWVWTPADDTPNAYAVFVRFVPVVYPGEPVRIAITASSHYELFINGAFLNRGPVFGDPKWRLYDVLEYVPAPGETVVQFVIVAHNSTGIPILAQRPAPGGVRAAFSGACGDFGTDESWKCLPLAMWHQDVPKRGWALDYCEDYDARAEPDGWGGKRFSEAALADWLDAVPVPDADAIWAGYQPRLTPYLRHSFVKPVRFDAFLATGPGADEAGDVSAYCDSESLEPLGRDLPYLPEEVNRFLAAGANAFTFDLGAEYIGHYALEWDAPAGRVVEISGAELLRDGRPWIVRKGTRYSIRYRSRGGRQTVRPFGWSGFRYVHVVVRGGTDGVTIQSAGCRERKAPLEFSASFGTDGTEDAELRRVFDLCRRTLEMGAQEHLIDCPSREQAQYWGDAVFIAQSLWKGFGEPSYLRWFLECYLHVPFTDDGQISSVYPGSHAVFPDYSLIPLIGQRFHRENTGTFYRVGDACEMALRLKPWYDGKYEPDGLLHTLPGPIPGEPSPYTVFIDHPGLGWHDFPHRGIDRGEISGPLNLFYFGWLSILSEMLAEAGRADEAARTARQAEELGAAIRRTFLSGGVFHDAIQNGSLSDGASWQMNCLAVYFGLSTGDEARQIMQTMLDRYETSCRCSPYFHFYFLPALRSAGLENEAITLIKREWKTMLDGGATTTWEGFEGDAKDSLCHPWSTAPFLYLVTG